MFDYRVSWWQVYGVDFHKMLVLTSRLKDRSLGGSVHLWVLASVISRINYNNRVSSSQTVVSAMCRWKLVNLIRRFLIKYFLQNNWSLNLFRKAQLYFKNTWVNFLTYEKFTFTNKIYANKCTCNLKGSVVQ